MPATAPAHLTGVNQPFWRDRLSQLLESTGEGIFGIDMGGCCTFITGPAPPTPSAPYRLRILKKNRQKG